MVKTAVVYDKDGNPVEVEKKTEEIRPDEELLKADKDGEHDDLNDSEINRLTEIQEEELEKGKKLEEKEPEGKEEEEGKEEGEEEDGKKTGKKLIIDGKEVTGKPGKAKVEVVTFDELKKKKGWTGDNALEKFNESYQNLEKLIEGKSKETKTTREELQKIKIEIAKLQGAKEALGKSIEKVPTSEASKEAEAELDEKWRKLQEESPAKYAQMLMDEGARRAEAKFKSHLDESKEKTALEEEDAEFQKVIDILPGKTQEEKEESFEQIKPLITEVIEEKAKKNEEVGIASAMEILIGRGRIAIVGKNETEEGEEEENLGHKKKALATSGKGSKIPKGKVTSKQLDKMSEKDVDNVSDKEIDDLVAQEEKELAKQ